MKLHVGCAMWTHAPWQGRYLPGSLSPRDRLRAYATWCNAVEGNTTFYATPALDTVKSWAGQTTPDFRFILKLPNGIKVAFLAFAPYAYDADLLDLPADQALIRQAGQEANVVVVYMHAGAEGPDADHVTGREEYYLGENRGNAEAFAHMAIDVGASLVIASGPRPAGHAVL